MKRLIEKLLLKLWILWSELDFQFTKPKKLKTIHYIIVHPGMNHMDELIACALAYAYCRKVPILRRNPTQKELKNPQVLVLDVGMDLNHDHMNFDHHQNNESTKGECAFSLFAKFLGIEDNMKKIFPWYKLWRDTDNNGPFGVCKSLGIDFMKIDGLVKDPASYILLKRWRDSFFGRIKITKMLATYIKDTIDAFFDARYQTLITVVKGECIVGDFTNLPKKYTSLIPLLTRAYGINLVLTNDSRGSGYSLMKVNDYTFIDFSKCKGKSYTSFIHKNGFMMTTKDKNIHLTEIIEDIWSELR